MSMISSRAWTHRSREKSSNCGKNSGNATKIPQSTPGLPNEADGTFRVPASFLQPQVADLASFQQWKLASNGQPPPPRKPLPPIEGGSASQGHHVLPACHYVSLSPCPHLAPGWLWSYLTDSCEDRGVGDHLEGKKRDKGQTSSVT